MSDALSSVGDFLTMGPQYFPGWLSILFAIGLGAGIVHHMPCVRRGGIPRWFHLGHIVMALSMIYMHLGMSYNWNWLSAIGQMWLFVFTSIGYAVYIAFTLGRRRALNILWIEVFMHQFAMVFMWMPTWWPWVSIAFTLWFSLETLGWIFNVLPDDVRMRAKSFMPYTIGFPAKKPNVSQVRPLVVSTSMSQTERQTGLATLTEHHDDCATPATADDCHCSDATVLIGSSWTDRILMAIMASSMAYMFLGMQALAGF